MIFAITNSGNAYDTSVQFDAGGRETNDGVFTYTYDSVNRLQSATPDNPIAGSLQAKYGYDNQNRMLWEDVNVYDGGTHAWTLSYSRHFVWDGTNMLAVMGQNNVLLQSYTYGPSGLLAITSYPADPANPDPNSGAITYMVVTDASGNVVELANPVTGSVDASYHYGAYGDNYTASGPAKNMSPFAFAGGYRDPVTGLSYFLNRWYSPSQGRFITQDPTGADGGLNYYAYANNDPVSFADPTGLRAEYTFAKQVTTDADFNRTVSYTIYGRAFHPGTPVIASGHMGITPFPSGTWGPLVPIRQLTSTFDAAGPHGTSEDDWDANIQLQVDSLNLNDDAEGQVAAAEGMFGLIPGFSVVDHATHHQLSWWDALDVGLLIAPGLLKLGTSMAGAFRAAGRLSAEAEIATRALTPVEFRATEVGFAESIADPTIALEAASTPAETFVNPRLTQRLEAWRTYKANGGSLNMKGWVSSTQGAAWGTGFKSGYGKWIRSVESVHGNSALSTRTAYLYRLEDADGNLLKWGITQDLNGRYSSFFLEGKELFPIARGSRMDMLAMERDLVETIPGPMNNEPWAGSRIGGW